MSIPVRLTRMLLVVLAAGGLLTSLGARPASALSIPCTSSTTTATVSPTSAPYGQTFTFSAQVTSSASTAGIGEVLFYIDQTQVGSAALGSTSSASFTTGSPVSVGSHSWHAYYTGGSLGPTICSSETDAAQLEVTRRADATSMSVVSSSGGHSSFGQPVTFTAHVAGTPVSPGGGSVTFLVDGVPATTTAIDGSGNATFVTSALAAGAHSVAAQYAAYNSSTDAFAASQSTSLVETVAPAQHATATTLTATPSATLYGQAMSVAVHVSAGAAAVPGGNVTVYVDGAPVTNPAVNSSGGATYTTASLAPGTHRIYAQYGGYGALNDAYAASASPVASVTVSARTTTTALTATPNPSTDKEPVTFTAAVTDAASGAAVTSGTATLTIDGKTVATAPLNPQGAANFTVGPLGLGSHAVTASFSGTATELSSASPRTPIQVNRPPVINLPVMGATAFFTFRHLSSGASAASQFNVVGLPAGAQLRLSCSGRGCPIKTISASIARQTACKGKHCTTRGRGRLNLRSRLAGKRFPAGTRLQLDITKRGWIGKRYVFTMRAHRDPEVRISYPAGSHG